MRFLNFPLRWIPALLLCAAVTGVSGPTPLPSLLRLLYPAYDPGSGLLASEGLKLAGVIAPGMGSPGARRIPLIVVWSQLESGGSAEPCRMCPRVVDVAVADSTGRPIAFSRALFQLEAEAEITLAQEEFLNADRHGIIGIRIRRSASGVVSENLHLIDVRPPSRIVFGAQSLLTTCGSSGPDLPKQRLEAALEHDPSASFPLSLHRTVSDCFGNVSEETKSPLLWDLEGRRYVEGPPQELRATR